MCKTVWGKCENIGGETVWCDEGTGTEERCGCVRSCWDCEEVRELV